MSEGVATEPVELCYVGDQPADAQTQASAQNPATFLEAYPNGGSGLSSAVRNLAMTDPNLLEPLAKLIAAAEVRQRTAVGAGLGQAATACETKATGVAQSIQRLVVLANDASVETTFRSVTGDAGTALTSAAAASSASSAVGGPAGNTAAQAFGSTGGNAVANTRRRFAFQVDPVAIPSRSGGGSDSSFFSVSP